MATFTVNGKSVTVEKNQKLIRFLRPIFSRLFHEFFKTGVKFGSRQSYHIVIRTLDGRYVGFAYPFLDGVCSGFVHRGKIIHVIFYIVFAKRRESHACYCGKSLFLVRRAYRNASYHTVRLAREPGEHFLRLFFP